MTKSVMVVDDSKTTRSMVAFTLRRAGLTVLEAEDGASAVALCKDRHIDCIITDVNMPGMDGVALIRHMRGSTLHRDTPILMLTTITDMARKEEGRAAGATGFLGKPFLPAHLIEAVSKIM
jgi:two-component system chemotaxis response regulator CheY